MIHLENDLPLRAEFNPLIRPYLVLSIGFTLAMTIIGIPLAIIWFLGVGQWWARHYFDKLECELTDQSLRYRKGILFQVEKTIPLENIQDVTFIEGPLLKRFNLSILKFETAGQSAGKDNEMKLVGIIDAHDYRAQILAARERIKHRHAIPPAAVNATVVDSAQAEALRAIQHSLEEIASLLKDRLPK
jgi:membrane protein YdbS with pleckstrin-like domain